MYVLYVTMQCTLFEENRVFAVLHSGLLFALFGGFDQYMYYYELLPPRNVTVTRKEAPIPDLHVSRSGAVRHFFSESICIDKYRHF